jgi:hypothetical protein
VRRTPRRTASLALVALCMAGPAAAADQRVALPVLHVDPQYKSCFFDLHPELTQAEFAELTAELGSILRPRQLGDASTLGKGRFEVGPSFGGTGIDDSKGAWNNSMSHPTADHYLGDAIELPLLSARAGVSDRVDLGISGGANPHSNYGLATLDAKIALMRQGPARPVSIAVRPTLSSLIGPAELWIGNASIDLSVSRRFGAFSPYLGGASNASFGVERSTDVDLEDEVTTGSVVYGGLGYVWRTLALAAEAEHGKLTSYSFRVSARF